MGENEKQIIDLLEKILQELKSIESGLTVYHYTFTYPTYPIYSLPYYPSYTSTYR